MTDEQEPKEHFQLTYVSPDSYESLIRDAENLSIQGFVENYKAGWMFRVQGALLAKAVRDCTYLDSYDPGCDADGLFGLVMENERDIFEYNGLESIKPSQTIFESMLYSMCVTEVESRRRRL